jgi:hypothetical protein
MKLREHLNELDIIQLREIAKTLHCIDGKDYFDNRNLYISKICYALDKYLWDTIENKDADIYIDKRTLADLKKLSFGLTLINEQSYFCLRRLGIVFKINEVPDDLREKFINRWKPEIIKCLDNYQIEVRPSAFLKLILLIGYIEKEKFNTYEELLNNNISNKESLNIIVDYLENVKIIRKKHDGAVSLNQYFLNMWRKNILNAIREFYEFYFNQKNIDNSSLLSMLKAIQNNSGEWINVNESKFLLDEFQRELNVLRDVGGIYYVEEKSEVYIQISPEFWFMLTGQFHQDWEIQNTIITPDFELFVPYYFNPFIIDIVNRNSELLNQIIFRNKRKKYNSKSRKGKTSKIKKEIESVQAGCANDYYLIYNIKNIKYKMGDEAFDKIFSSIFSNVMPDIVKDEFGVKLDNI